MTRVLVTGARGFVGRAVCAQLLAREVEVIASSRTPVPIPGARVVALGPDSAAEDVSHILRDVDAVIHLAALVHDVHGKTSPAAYDRVNRQWVDELAAAAVGHGVRRFVLASTVKVNGDETPLETPFDESAPPAPIGAYAESKWAAEQAVSARTSAGGGTSAAIVRPPLVYGPGVGANFRSLVRLVARGWPLPLGHVRNARSLVFVDNLADALARLALDKTWTTGSRTFFVSDGEDMSTPDLIRRIAGVLGIKARLWPAPGLDLALRAARRGAIAQRLLRSLRVDSGAIRTAISWRPPYTVDEGLARTVPGLASRR